MFTLPDLLYAYDALEPYIDEATMHIHHDKHHKAYMDKFNIALEKYPDFYKKTVEEILSDINSIPEDVRTAVKNNGGGYFHHSIFWQMMSSDGGKIKGKIKEAVDKTFGSFDKFKEEFTTKASTHFASGWTWLVKDKKNNLSIISTSNQDSPISQGLTPLLGIDTWEHAYYLKYQNRRPEYIEAWWNIANWDYAEKIFKS